VLSSDFPNAGPFAEDGLTQLEIMTVRAWQARSVARAPQPRRPWNAPGHEPPVHVEHAADASGTPPNASGEAEDQAPDEPRLIGSVAVGIVMVSGADAAVKITAKEQQRIIQEVADATQFLVAAEPRANISFDYDLRLVDVRTKPGSKAASSDPYEQKEAPWRDAALQVMGHADGEAGYRAYAASLRADRGTQWAYVVFFTKYPLHHFAYAIHEKVVMEYANGSWGPDSLNAVFAHETCHLFGAADEYGSCQCDSKHGALKAPNKNCVTCPGTRVACLMESNQLALCPHSRLQLGWGAPVI
jgi:hypothetical protein